VVNQSVNQSTRRRSSLDEIGSGETDNGQETSDGVHASTGSHRLGNIRGGRLVVLVRVGTRAGTGTRVRARTGGAVTTAATLASTVATLTALATTVGAVVVAGLLALRSLSTLGTGVRRRRSDTGRVSTARRNGVVGVGRVDSGSVVGVIDRNGVSDGLGHTLAVVGGVRVGVGLSLGDNVLAGVSRLMRLARLGRVVVSRLGWVVDLSDRADSCGNSNGLGCDMANRAVDDGGRALSDGVSLGAVDSAGSVLSRPSDGAVLVDSGESNVSIVVVSVGNSGRSSEDDGGSLHDSVWCLVCMFVLTNVLCQCM
jgi:hypothetical protein